MTCNLLASRLKVHPRDCTHDVDIGCCRTAAALADPGGDRHLRMHHRDLEFRSARLTGYLSDPDVASPRLGAGGVCTGTWASELIVGRGSAARRGDRRPFRNGSGMVGGTLLYAVGLAIMAHANTPGLLNLSAGVLLGFGLSGC